MGKPEEAKMRGMNDLTTGNVALKTIGFAIPIIITNLLQAFYNIADMAIIGRYIGSSGMSAVNIGGQVTMIILVFALGVSNGGGLIIGQLFGGKQKEKIPSVVGTMLSFFFLMALFFMIVIYALGVPILKGLDTPAEAYTGTKTYLFICLAGTIFIYFYNIKNNIYPFIKYHLIWNTTHCFISLHTSFSISCIICSTTYSGVYSLYCFCTSSQGILLPLC